MIHHYWFYCNVADMALSGWTAFGPRHGQALHEASHVPEGLAGAVAC